MSIRTVSYIASTILHVQIFTNIILQLRANIILFICIYFVLLNSGITCSNCSLYHLFVCMISGQC